MKEKNRDKMREDVKEAVHKMAMYVLASYFVVLAVAVVMAWYLNPFIVMVTIVFFSIGANVVVDRQTLRIRKHFEEKYHNEPI